MASCIRYLLILLSVVGIGGFVFHSYASSNLKLAVADTDAIDSGWRIGGIEATRAKISDVENSALVIEAGERLIRKDERWFSEHPCLDNIAPSPAQRLNALQVAAIQDVLTKQALAMAELRKVCHMPRGRFALAISDNPSEILPTKLGTRRLAVVALRYDLYDRLEANDTTGAAERIIGCLNAGHAIHDEPFLISYLIRIAVDSMTLSGCERFLALCEANDETLAKLQAELEKVEAEPTFYWAVRGERGWAFAAFEYYKRKPAKFSDNLGADANLWEHLLPFVPGLLDRAQAAHLLHMNQVVDLSRAPPETWDGRMPAIEQSARDLPNLADQSVGSMFKIIQAAQRQAARYRCMIVAIAAERYRVKHGKWPEKLNDLVSDMLLSNVPIDPYGGKTLRWKRTADGAVVYSVHADGIDDNGDIGRGAVVFPTKDVGYELFDPAKRRQAPPA